MKASSSCGPEQTADDCMLQATVEKFTGKTSYLVKDSLAIQEPLEIQRTHGPSNIRQTRSILVTMRTPGNDFELAAGSLMTEGVIQNANDVEQIAYAGDSFNESTQSPQAMDVLKFGSKANTIRVDRAPEVAVNVGNLQRNFDTTSSCGICGKASLVARRVRQTTSKWKRSCSIVSLSASEHLMRCLIGQVGCTAPGSSTQPGTYWRVVKT
jgi:FdhD protein